MDHPDAITLADLPTTDAPVTLDAERGVLTVAAVAAPDDRIRRFSAARDDARYRAKQRALARLHRFVDDAMALRGVGPWHAQAVHGALRTAARVVAAAARAHQAAAAAAGGSGAPRGARRARVQSE